MPTLELTRDEIVAQIDAEARRLGYSGAADLMQQWTAGTADVGDAAGALILADLLEGDDPLFG